MKGSPLAEGSRGLQLQHGEIEQATTAVTEMTTAIEEVARRAASTSDLSRESRNIAMKGQQRSQRKRLNR